MKTFYVGNLPYNSTEAELKSVFEFCGFVVSRSKVCMDRETGNSRGFGFVDVEGDTSTVIDTMVGQTLGDRELRVRESESKTRPAPRGRDRDLL